VRLVSSLTPEENALAEHIGREAYRQSRESILPVIAERYHRLHDRVIRVYCVRKDRCAFAPADECACRALDLGVGAR
jgi:hypothetical protein